MRTMTRLRATIAFALSLCLVLASFALAMARGQAEPTYEAVICSGFGTHVVYLDEDGNPVLGPTLCPDGVTAFATDIAVAAAPQGVSDAWQTLSREIADHSLPSRTKISSPARGPPPLI